MKKVNCSVDGVPDLAQFNFLFIREGVDLIGTDKSEVLIGLLQSIWAKQLEGVVF